MASVPKPHRVGAAQHAMRESKKFLDKKVRAAESLKQQLHDAEQVAINALSDFEECQANCHKAVRSLAEHVPPE
eukprot:4372231-Pyramimonas_sp.AAC.1